MSREQRDEQIKAAADRLSALLDRLDAAYGDLEAAISALPEQIRDELLASLTAAAEAPEEEETLRP